MNLHHHVVAGCSPAPLANYLKALGILRLVSQQFDRACRGWWQDECFHLLSTKTQTELESFFLEQYEPTPIFNPWGGRSGFYPGSPEATTRLALEEIEQSNAKQLGNFNRAIGDIKRIIEDFGSAKPSTTEAQHALVSEIRKCVRGPAIEWLETVLADLGEKFQGPPIFGTGGNEGSGSYTAAYFSAIVECIVHRNESSGSSRSIFNDGSDENLAWDGSFRYQTTNKKKVTTLKKKEVKAPFRQFLPEGNASPWDLLFAFEGAIAFQSSVVRRSMTGQTKHLSSPFFFYPLGAGNASSSEYDEFVLNKGRKNPGRGEQWFPLWNRPSTYHEVSAIIRDGKCSIGRKNARQPLDAALAMASLGVSSGIQEFVRYGYLQRNNQATHFAIPLGRMKVHEGLHSRIASDLCGWEEFLRRLARGKTASSRVIVAHRSLANAMIEAIGRDSNPALWQAVLRAAVEMEAIQASGTGIDAGPIPALSTGWLQAIDDGSPEVRLAIALGSAAAAYSKKGWRFDSIRHHWLPLTSDHFPRFNTSDKRLINDPRVVCSGRDFLADCSAVVERRLIEAEKSGQRRLPIVAARGCGASLRDLVQFISGNVDVQKIALLARATMAVRWDQLKQEQLPASMQPRRKLTAESESSNDTMSNPASSSSDFERVEEAWLMLRLAHLAWPLADGRNIYVEPSIVRLLRSGDATRAVEIASRRLKSSGFRPPLYASFASGDTPLRWAAALIFPISYGTARLAAELIDPRFQLEGQLNA